MTARLYLAGICSMAVFLAACALPANDPAASRSHQAGVADAHPEAGTRAERLELRRQLSESGQTKITVLETVPRDDAADTMAAEVPDAMLSKMIEDLLARTGAERGDIEVLHAASVTFSDGSLGCGKPGQVYTQALVPGYRVVLGVHGQPFDYRATAKGYFMLCEQPYLAPPGSGFEAPFE